MVSPMEEFWPILPGPQKENYTKLYRGYKRLINTISEKLRKGDVLSLAYQHDLPVWYSEVGPMHEPGYALRVMGQMEGMEIFSPTNLGDLIQGLDTIGRVDLGNMVRAFENQHKDIIQEATVPIAIPETFRRTETSRRSFEHHRQGNLWAFSSMRHRNRVETYQGDIFDQNPVVGIPMSESHSRQGSMDRYSADRSREGTPFETISDPEMPITSSFNTSSNNDVQLGISMARLSAEMLGNQLQLMQQTLANQCSASAQLHQSLTNAFLLTRQITSHLNIATDAVRMMPEIKVPDIRPDSSNTRQQNGMGNEHSRSPYSSPRQSRHNSFHDLRSNSFHDPRKSSQASLPVPLPGQFHCWDQLQEEHVVPSVQPRAIPMYRTMSQPTSQVSLTNKMDMSPSSISHGERESPFSPLESREDIIGDLVNEVIFTSQYHKQIENPPPLPPRPSNLPLLKQQSDSLHTLSTQDLRVLKLEKSDEPKIPRNNGHWCIRPSKSEQELNNIIERDSKSKHKETSYTNWTSKLFSKRNKTKYENQS